MTGMGGMPVECVLVHGGRWMVYLTRGRLGHVRLARGAVGGPNWVLIVVGWGGVCPRPGRAGDDMRLRVGVVLWAMRGVDGLSQGGCGAGLGLGAVPRGLGAIIVSVVDVGPAAGPRWLG
jgi:hypothetical protein